MSQTLSPPDRRTLLDALCDTPQFLTSRGRHSLITIQLAGYPRSAAIHKALRFVDWQGSAVEVADQLLHHLEGHEVDSGVPALALIAQAIEPMAGSEHRDKIASLRRRMNWGGVSPPAADSTWDDSRSTDQLVQERIIGENTLKPIHYLRSALVAAEAVVRIDWRGRRHGTGFLIAPNLLMTNHHVIQDENQAKDCQFYFFDDDDAVRKPVIAYPAAEALLYADKPLDFSLVRLKDAPTLKQYLPLKRVVMEKNQRVAIIQHPGGYPKRISMQNNMVAMGNTKIVQYYTSTMGGSSGSPVFDDDFAVVAIHHAWVAADSSPAKKPEDLQYRNEGISMIAVLEQIEKSVPKIFQKLRIL